MSVWGKFGGAAAGLFVGGPVGALVGAVAGHFLIDREGDPGVTFTIAVIALAGKMARADGNVSDAELEAFRRVFRMPSEEEANVARIFNLARQDVAGYEYYAGQIARLFVGNPAVLEDILDGLFEIAKADGVLHPGESQFLERVADIFGFAPNEFRRIRAAHFAPELTDPYVILGVSYVAGDDEIRQTYRRLVRENHPDSLIARGVPPEFEKLANDKLAAINNAWGKIRDERGLK
ncbi:MAG: molecular chaperone DjlA [Alphaproteobacteria bacterium 64-11]|nr:TerB family tellurite resistance protein [Alphaproteobacteria bacterium]OJU12432.1 MAG: molecular chaperone DjlA [Alphaproteobacteria bacterium 64-11]